MTIVSNSGKKEANIRFTIPNGYTATIVQVSNNGLEIVKDYFQSKSGFLTSEKATKWALKIMNPNLK